MRRQFWILLAAAFALYFLAPVVAGVAHVLPTEIRPVVLFAFVVVMAALTLRTLYRYRDRVGSIWNLVPPWQYCGRYIEMGGATVAEQDRALETIRSRAEAMEQDGRGDDAGDPEATPEGFPGGYGHGWSPEARAVKRDLEQLKD
jgi:hypothetical protein